MHGGHAKHVRQRAQRGVGGLYRARDVSAARYPPDPRAFGGRASGVRLPRIERLLAPRILALPAADDARHQKLTPAIGRILKKITYSATRKITIWTILRISGSGENRSATHHATISTTMIMMI